MKHLLFSALLLLPSAFCLAQKQTAWSEDGCWAFLPGQDPYNDKAVFSLRPLLDNVAGEKGWIKINADGDFTRGDGSPIRFWATGSGVFENVDREKMEEHARHLSKRGINLVRLFKSRMNADKEPMSTTSDKFVEQFQMGVSVLQKEGIYSLITIYWNSGGDLFWDEEVQANYKNWWRELLTRPNPHDPDRKPLKDNPAIAILQIQNEASLYWWQMQGFKGGNERQQAAYAKMNAEFKEWQKKNNLPDADLDFLFWDINRGDPKHAHEPRESLKLTMRFVGEKMRAFNAEIERFLREDIGCPALVNAGNWRTADQVRLLDWERWSYDANEVIADNRYVDNPHQNANGRVGWLVEAGDTFENHSCLVGDGWRRIPVNVKQVKGKPFLVTETGWVSPGLYQAEAPFLVSTYMSLNGVDACFWLGIGSVGYDVASWPWMPGMYKWGNHASPQNMGGWPAAAWMFHKGYIKRGAVVVDEKRGFEGDMWELKVPVIAEDSGFDPNQPGTARAQNNVAGGAHAAAFLMGQVLVEFGKNPADTKVDLHGNNPADYARGVIKSTTGEVTMDTPRGVCVVNAPCAQGVVGFLRDAGTVETDALTIEMENEYAAVLAVSLDDQPLDKSKKVLLQITTQSRPDGWSDEVATLDGKEVLRIKNTGGGIHNAGKNHWQVKNSSGIIAIKNDGLTKATLCDINFYAQDEIPVKRARGALEIKLPPNALYVVLE